MPAISEFHPSLDASVQQFAAGLRRHEPAGRAGKKPRMVVAKPASGPRSAPLQPPAARLPARASTRTAAPAAPRRVVAGEASGRPSGPPSPPRAPVEPPALAVSLSSLPWGMPELPPAETRVPAQAADFRPLPPAGSPRLVAGEPTVQEEAVRRPGPKLMPGEKQGFADVAIPLPPRRNKVLKNILYLPVRVVNVALAGVLTLVSLGKAWPVLAYAAARMGESMGAVLDPLKDSVRVRAGEADFRTGKPTAASTASARMTPAGTYFKRQLENFRKQDLPRRKSDAQWRLGGRSVSFAVGAGLFAGTAMALTAVFPPLGLAVAVFGGLALWVGAANVLYANKSRRLAGAGQPALPMAGSPLGNAFYRGKVESAGGRWIRWGDHMKARAQAASFARNFGIAWGVAGIALSVAGAPAAVPSLAKFLKSAVGWLGSGFSWGAERIAGWLPGKTHTTDWEAFDQAILAYRDSLRVDGSEAGDIARVPDEVKAGLLASGFSAEDLERFFSPDWAERLGMPVLRRAGDAPLETLRQSTDIAAAFVLGRAVIGTTTFAQAAA